MIAALRGRDNAIVALMGRGSATAINMIAASF